MLCCGAERWDSITSPCLHLKIKHRMFCKFLGVKQVKFSDETQLWAAGCFGLCAVFCVQCSVCRAALRWGLVASYAASKSDLEESCITCSVGFILNDKDLREGWKHQSLSFRNDCKQGRNELTGPTCTRLRHHVVSRKRDRDVGAFQNSSCNLVAHAERQKKREGTLILL